MSATDHLHELQFHPKVGPDSGVLNAMHDGQRVGQIVWRAKDAHAWELRSDKSQAATDGRSRIWLKGDHTNDLTLLHEVAHIIHGSTHDEGHGPAFQETLEGLYRKHLGEEAASIFRGIIRPAP